MCKFHDSNGNGFGDIWWTDELTYFSSIDYCIFIRVSLTSTFSKYYFGREGGRESQKRVLCVRF